MTGARGGKTPPKNKKPRSDPPPLAQKRWCSIHNTNTHDLAECRSVKNLAERLRQHSQERRAQGPKQPEGKAAETSTPQHKPPAAGGGPDDETP